MKRLTLLLTLLTLSLTQLKAQTGNSQTVNEHWNITSDLRIADAISYLTNTVILNGHFVSRISSTGNVDLSREYHVDGLAFRPWNIMEIGGQLVIEGNAPGSGDGRYLIATDLNGNPRWAKYYSYDIGAMNAAMNGNIIIASVVRSHNKANYLLAELDYNNGDIVRYTLTELDPSKPAHDGDVKSIDYRGDKYLAILEIDGKPATITSAPDLGYIEGFFWEEGGQNLLNFKEIIRKKGGQFYLIAEDPTSKEILTGELTTSHTMNDMRRVSVSGWDLSLPQNGPVSTESRNAYTWYHGPFPGTITHPTNNNVYNITATMKNSNGDQRTLLVQWDEWWNLYYDKMITYSGTIGQSNLIHHYSKKQLHLLTTFTFPGSPFIDLFENRLPDDLLGCNLDDKFITENSISMNRTALPWAYGSNEFEANNVDVNYYDNTSAVRFTICSSNKTANEAAINEARANRHQQSDAALSPEANPGTQITLYPNPSNGTVNIESNGAQIKNIKIHDLTGRIIRQETNPGNRIQNLPTGAYMIRITTETSTYNQKLIVR